MVKVRKSDDTVNVQVVGAYSLHRLSVWCGDATGGTVINQTSQSVSLFMRLARTVRNGQLLFILGDNISKLVKTEETKTRTVNEFLGRPTIVGKALSFTHEPSSLSSISFLSINRAQQPRPGWPSKINVFVRFGRR